MPVAFMESHLVLRLILFIKMRELMFVHFNLSA